MCTIDMTGVNIKEKKVLLSITKEEFIKKLTFHSEDEKTRCLNYLDLKGLSYHVVLANFIGFNSKGKIEYKKVSNLYKYDKRIRNILYKYLSALEEGIRGFISNTYSNDLKKFKKLSKRIFDLIQQGSSLTKELENLEFNKLIDLSMKLDESLLIQLYGSVDNLEANLNAVRVLRNTVSHHRMLFVYEDFEICYIDGIECNSLIDNIRNLHQLLKPYYKEFFKDAINRSCTDEEDSQFKYSLPIKAVLSI